MWMFILGLMVGWAIADYSHNSYENKLEHRIRALRSGGNLNDRY